MFGDEYRILTQEDRRRIMEVAGLPGLSHQPKGHVSVYAPDGSIRFYPRKGAKQLVEEMNRAYQARKLAKKRRRR